MTHDHDPNAGRTKSLRERHDSGIGRGIINELFSPRASDEISHEEAAEMVQAIREYVLAEIERRAAERGYTTMIGIDDRATFGTSIADFIAEIRAEVTGE